MDEICIITVVKNKEVRFYFKEGKLNKICKMKFGFVISSVSRKQRKKFKKIVKDYLRFFLENNIDLFEKLCGYTDDSKLINWCKEFVTKENIELFYIIAEATKKRNDLIKIRKNYF